MTVATSKKRNLKHMESCSVGFGDIIAFIIKKEKGQKMGSCLLAP